MIRARLSNGQFILGIDAENVRRLKDGKPIRVDLSDHGGIDTVIIFYGETMGHLFAQLEKIAGPLPPAQPMPTKRGMPS